MQRPHRCGWCNGRSFSGGLAAAVELSILEGDSSARGRSSYIPARRSLCGEHGVRDHQHARIPVLVSTVAAGIFMLATAIGLVPAQSTKPTRFEDYRVPSIYKGPVKPLHLADPNRYSGTAEGRCVGGEAPAGYTPHLRVRIAVQNLLKQLRRKSASLLRPIDQARGRPL
jgi:hypothetical protein